MILLFSAERAYDVDLSSVSDRIIRQRMNLVKHANDESGCWLSFNMVIRLMAFRSRETTALRLWLLQAKSRQRMRYVRVKGHTQRSP